MYSQQYDDPKVLKLIVRNLIHILSVMFIHAVCGFSGNDVRIVPGPKASNGFDSHLIQRFAINSADEKVL